METASLQEPGTTGQIVQTFYEGLPFNYADATDTQARMIRMRNQVALYGPLDALLRQTDTTRVLDVGCGAGWFVNTVGSWYGKAAWGVDFCARALERAQATAAALGVGDVVRFVRADVHAMPDVISQTHFDIVNSLGVLHHLPDCRRGVELAASLVKPGGYLHVGLYHRYGRRPLLDLFEPTRAAIAAARSDVERVAAEEAGFARWRPLHGEDDPVFLRSWYRDQCLHPHETQWTAGELIDWFDACGFEPLATSLNRFAANPDWSQVVRDEPQQEALGRTRLAEGRYFPGFFTILGRKR